MFQKGSDFPFKCSKYQMGVLSLMKSERRVRRSIYYYLEIVLDKLKDGVSWSDLDASSGRGEVPKATLSRILNLLKRVGIIYKDEKDGKYYYIWRKSIRVLSKERYEIALNHSKKLVESKNPEKLVESKYFLEHLETGYPNIYDMYTQWEKAKEDLEKIKKEFENAIKEEISEAGFKIINDINYCKGKVVSTNIFGLIERLYSYNIREVELDVDRNNVYCKPYKALPISSDPSAIQELKDLITRLLNSQKLREIYEKYAKLDEDVRKSWSGLEIELIKLINKVEHGEPLEGECDLCPRILIKEESEETKRRR